ncbi:MAG TPA: ABC transporter permease [Steroidobacteraceae bacterium]|nr:ABC transporter permease [Steroidobacteraceae bacterium]
MSLLRKKLARDLWAVRGQVLTIALVVASATGGFLGSVGTYRALERARDNFYAQSQFGDVFADLKRAPLSVSDQVIRLPAVLDAQANVVAGSQLFLGDVAEPLIAQLVGIPAPAGPRLNRLYVRRGRMIEPGPVLEALVDEGFAAARHLNPGDRVTVQLNGKRRQLSIVGIGLSPEYINPSAGGAFPDPKGVGVFWLDEQPLAAAFDLRDAFNHLTVLRAPGVSDPALVRRLDEILRPYGGRGAYARADQLSHRIVSQEMNQQRVLGTVMPSLFVWVAAFLLNVVLARQIATQREQIAALKALGFGNGSIVAHYLQFVAVVVGLGVALGVGVGLAFGRYMTGLYGAYFHFPLAEFHIEPTLLGIAAAISLAAGAGGALLAIRRIVRLSPAQAMRPPTPPRYRKLLLERLGLATWLATVTRMVLRNLERRPARSLLAIAGVAASVGLIVSGTFWWDALNYLVDTQFNSIERGDAVLTFVEPRGSRTRFEVARLPGVIQAEPYRTVPVQLRSAQHGYRTVIFGLDPGAALRRTLDERQRVLSVPREGMLLSSRLAERLGVSPGERVEVEALEGSRIHRDVLVAGVVKDLFGQLAYMDRAALNRLMDEGDSMSAFDLRLDAARQEALFAQVKLTPSVASLQIKQNSLASFRETSARNVLVFTTIFTVFAATIAVGVVYNSARISLAERAWELASLRVLGFSRAEVSAMLLGELAIEVGIGIPLGLWFGRGLALFLTELMHSETFRIPVVIAPQTYVFAAAAIVVAGVLSALIVRRRIDHLDLVAVLKIQE